MTKNAQSSAALPTGAALDNRRIAAALIDGVLPIGLLAVALIAGLSVTLPLLLVIAAWMAFYCFALESGDGQTLGKRVMKLRVTTPDGATPDLRQLAVRNAVRILDGHIIGLVTMLVSGDRRQRLGDMAAGTIVVDAETPLPNDFYFPPVERRPPPTGARGVAVPAAAHQPVEPVPPPAESAPPRIESAPPRVEPPRSPMEPAPAIERSEQRDITPAFGVPPAAVPPPAPAYEEPFRASSPAPVFRAHPQQTATPAAPEQRDNAPMSLREELQDPAEAPSIKPIETVSAIDLVMQDAERRQHRD